MKPGTFPKKAGPTTAELKGAGLLTSSRIAKVNRAKYKKIKTRGKVRKGIVFMKVQSPTTKAKVRISLMGLNKRGAWVTLRTYKRIVKANTKKFVRAKIVKPAKLAKRVRRVETTIIRTAGTAYRLTPHKPTTSNIARGPHTRAPRPFPDLYVRKGSESARGPCTAIAPVLCKERK